MAKYNQPMFECFKRGAEVQTKLTELKSLGWDITRNVAAEAGNSDSAEVTPVLKEHITKFNAIILALDSDYQVDDCISNDQKAWIRTMRLAWHDMVVPMPEKIPTSWRVDLPKLVHNIESGIFG